jgi:hypothetical protein
VVPVRIQRLPPPTVSDSVPETLLDSGLVIVLSPGFDPKREKRATHSNRKKT